MECVTCVLCLARGGVGGEGGEWMRDWVWALPILWGQGECWTCVCVLVAVGVGGVGGEWVGGLGPGSGAVGWCYVCMRCESGFSV